MSASLCLSTTEIDPQIHPEKLPFHEALLRSLSDIGQGILVIEDRKIVFANDALSRLSGYSIIELKTWSSFLELFHADERQCIMQNHERRITGRKFKTCYESALQHKRGHRIDIEMSVALMKTNRSCSVVITMQDIVKRKRDQEALFQEKELAQVTLKSIGDAVITTDSAHKVTYLNPVAEQLTGWSCAEGIGKSIGTVFHLLEETSDKQFDNPLLREQGTEQVAMKAKLIARNGRQYSIEDTVSAISSSTGQKAGMVIVFRDVTRAREMADRISYRATHDALTGLVNRYEFERSALGLINHAKSSKKKHSLLYLDLDQFKVVNDTCGHLAGDNLLRELSTLLLAKMRQSDTLARLGGDEFGVLLVGCPLKQAVSVAQMLIETIRSYRFNWNAQSFKVGVSIGVVEIDADHGENLQNVLSAADTACYIAKDKGRNRLQVFRRDDADVSQRRLEMNWVSRITQAYEENRFVIYYQEIIPVSVSNSSAAIHCELLLRLREESGVIVPPMAFIPSAERYNMMRGIDRWVVATSFERLGRFMRNRGDDNAPMFTINLSGASMNEDGLPEFIFDQFTRTGIPPHCVCFEITEAVAISSLSKAACFMSTLKRMGCLISLDDFGSGLSSFGYLKSLPIDYLKIDGNFVRDIHSNPINYAMVKAISSIGHAMGIKTVAKFVEDDKILPLLQEIGVDYAQGYGIHVPELFDCRTRQALR